MQQFVFDREELRQICRLAYKHGLVDGSRIEPIVTQHGADSFEISEYCSGMDLGKILNDEQPCIWVDSVKQKNYYDSCPKEKPPRILWFLIGAVVMSVIWYWFS
jgi:hypothetical protein